MVSGSKTILDSNHLSSTLVKATLPHVLWINPDRNSEVQYLVKYIQQGNKNKPKNCAQQSQEGSMSLMCLSVTYSCLDHIFLPQSRGRNLTSGGCNGLEVA